MFVEEHGEIDEMQHAERDHSKQPEEQMAFADCIHSPQPYGILIKAQRAH